MNQEPLPVESHQIILILDDDAMVTEGLAAGLERRGRTLITCNDLETAELSVEWIRPTHVISDVRLTGPFAYEGLDFIRFVKRHAPETRIILITGEAPEALQLEASERGAVAFLQKPFEISQIDAILDLMAPLRSGSANWPDVIRVPTLDEILGRSYLTSVFQPIVHLSSGQVAGWEALTRCRSESPLRNPETLFRYATRKDRIADLEASCIGHSIPASASLPGALPLFLNIHPTAFASPQIDKTIREAAEAARVPLDRLVLEITEQASLGHDRRILQTIATLQKLKIRFAFDDVGIAYSHLPYFDSVRPAYLKVSQHFGTGFEADPTKTKIIRNLLTLASDFDSTLILEGIETVETADAARAMGIELGQGYFFARPGEAASFAADNPNRADFEEIRLPDQAS